MTGRWRVGRSIGRTVYEEGAAQPLAIALGADEEAKSIAAQIVADHNRHRAVIFRDPLAVRAATARIREATGNALTEDEAEWYARVALGAEGRGE